VKRTEVVLFYTLCYKSDKIMIELEYKLSIAIKEERYEDAEVIKKKISELKNLYQKMFK
jgi:protein-arginine kinase activator protein McsA